MVVGLRVEDRLEGISNFRSWKSRMLMLLNEQDLKDHVLKDISEPEAAKDKTKHKKNEVVAMRFLMDSVRDHLVPIISSHFHLVIADPKGSWILSTLMFVDQ